MRMFCFGRRSVWGWLLGLMFSFCVFSVASSGGVYEDFDGVTPPALPSGWSNIVVSGTESWGSTNVAGAKSTPNVVRLASGEAETNEVWLVSPVVAVSSNFVAQFYVRNASTNGTASLSLLASTNVGWTATNDFTVVITNDIVVSSSWTGFSINAAQSNALASLVGETNVYLGFQGTAADGGGLDLDNILLAGGLVPGGQAEDFAGGLDAGWLSQYIERPTSFIPQWAATNNWNGKTSVFYNSKESSNLNYQSARLSHRNHLDAGGSVNLVLSFDMYHVPSGTYSYPVTVQPQYTLDDGLTWQDTDESFLRDTEDYPPGWYPHQVVITDTNFADAASIRVGLLARHRGNTEENLYLANIGADFLTLVDLSPPSTEPAFPVYGDAVNVSLEIKKLPSDDVKDLAAFLDYRQVGATGDFTRIAMTNDGGSLWHTSEALPPYEAGVELEYYIEASYASVSGRATNSPQRMPVDTNVYERIKYRGLGSVWINEVYYHTNPTNQFVEIAGPSGRTIEGWSMEVLDDLGSGGNLLASYAISTNFNDEANGYGFYTLGGDGATNRNAALTNDLPVEGGLRLVNQDGVVEHAVSYGSDTAYEGFTNIMSSVTNASLSAVGYGLYVTNLWAGYHTNFTWESSEPTPATNNARQSFLLEPMKTTVNVFVYDAQSFPTNPVSSALFAIKFWLQGGAELHSITNSTGSDGRYSFTFTNLFNDVTNGIDCVVSAQGFGYAAGSNTVTISISPNGVTNQVDVGLLPVVAEDSFDGSSLADYWDSQDVVYPGGGEPEWGWSSTVGPDGQAGVAIYNVSVATRLDTYKYRLTHGNALNSQGMSVMSVEYWMKHTPDDSERDATLQVQYYTNTTSSSTWENLGTPVSRKDADWADQWQRHRFSLESDYFATNNMIHVGIISSNYYKSPDILIDDLRVSFGCDVLLGDLSHAPLAPRFDEALDLRFMMTPVGTGISNVTVGVVWSNSVAAGGWQTNAVTNISYRIAGSTNAWTATNLPLAVLTTNLEFELPAAIAAQPAESDLSYYVQVGFEGPGADSIGNGGTKYLPDNATYSNGLTTLHGPYLPDPETVGITGVASVWINEIYYHTAPSNQFVELAGTEVTDLTGWTLEVMDLETLISTNYALGSLGLTNGVTNSIGFLVLGGSAVPEADMALGALPAFGGLMLYDSETNLLRSTSYGAGAVFGFDDAGTSATNGYLAHTGTGNPANGIFAWTNRSIATIGFLNTNQVVIDAAAPILKGLFQDPVERSVTSLVVQVNASVDFNPPISYAFSNQTEAVMTSNWQTATVWTNVGLSENTAYTYVYRTVDALTNRSDISESRTYYTLLDTPDAPVLVADSTTALSASGSITNLGQGDTAIRFVGSAGDSDWITNMTWIATNLHPNTLYDVYLLGRNGVGIIAEQTSTTNSIYTLAEPPSVAPSVYMEAGKVMLSVTNVFDVSVNANPAATQYAIGTFGEDGVTNYLDASGVVTNAYVWRASTNWGNPLWAQVSVSETNRFFLVARNGDQVLTDIGPVTSISLGLSIEGISAERLIDRLGHIGLGHVEATAVVVNPSSNSCVVALQYSDAGSSGPWYTATVHSVASAYGTPVWTNGFATNGTLYQIEDVSTANGGTNTVTAVWDARTDLGTVINPNVWLRWEVLDAIDELTANDLIEIGTLDLLLNLLRPNNGGVLESFTGEASANKATNITDGDWSTIWSSLFSPATQQFVYSFNGHAASLSSFRIVNSSTYRSKDFAILLSIDEGETWTNLYSGTLLNNSNPIEVELGGQLATWVRLDITSGYEQNYWQLAEFELYGYTGAPLWWAERGVVTGTNAYDYSVLNAGQLKWMATNAMDELNVQLASVGGAGTNITAMVQGFSNENNYIPVYIGQLKYVAEAFYDRLRDPEANPNIEYPWGRNPELVNDWAVANVGQLKNVFSFTFVGDRVFAWPAPVVVVPEEPVEE